MKKILVLEDEASIRSFIVINLRRAGYDVIEAESGEEALERLRANPDVKVALLDIMLPGIDGFEVCRRIRATNTKIGIIMLTARSQEMDKVTGLMTGADDYVTKPFSPAELTARVDALFRRAGGEETAQTGEISQPPFLLNVRNRTLEKNGKQLSEGDLSTPVDTKRLFGAFRRYGQAMNRLQSGMESAVQEQMRAERMKTELITNVSHDIKTPLTSIVNYVDLLKKEDIPSPAAQEYIAVLDRQSKRLKKLTEDLVEASKASSGALPVDVQPTDVSVLFSQIAGEYQDRLADCHLTLVTQPPAGQPMVLADSKLLSRVMDNLVSNICKYAMPETRVYVSGVVSDGQMTLSFKNVSRAELNISPDELMERFVRGDASRHTEGSGLGLSIVRSLVQLMGGTFRLSIDADLFRADVTLPLVQQD